jgi:hypothetical protein
MGGEIADPRVLVGQRTFVRLKQAQRAARVSEGFNYKSYAKNAQAAALAWRLNELRHAHVLKCRCATS